MLKLLIVIVNWNSADLVQECLKSIKKNLKLNSYEVYVVDNASADNSIEVISQKFSWVKLIANQENLGFAKANNQVLKKIKSEYALILNPDTEITLGAIENMLEFLKEHPGVGAVGPVLLNSDRTVQKEGYYRRFPTLLQAVFFYTQLSKFSFKSKFLVSKLWESNFSEKTETEVDQIPGACLLVSTELLKKINYFDEDYPLWFEDVDLCFKIKNLGYKLMLVPQSKVIHIGSGSFNKWQDEVQKQIRFFKSLFIYADKHLNIFSRFIIRFIIIGDLFFLILPKIFRQIQKPNNNRKEFILSKLEVAKCLLVS